MNWFYAHEGKQIGPVTEEEFQQLRTSGVIAAGTLVWREGMANWQPLGELTASASPTLTPALNRGAAVLVCSGCGQAFPADEVVRLGDGFVCATCKPVALQRLREGVASSAAEDIRNEHIKHEASVKSVGVLYFIGAFFMVFLGGMMLIARPGPGGFEATVTGAVLVCLAGFQFATGLALRRLKRWARIVAGIFSGVGLLGFPLGTIINGFILYLLFSKKGKTVFSPEYQEVIAQTPHIKYRTSIIVWIVLGILVLIILLAVMGAFVSRTIQTAPAAP
ncbi:MAG TPA: GYF domain-containing protein [Verrucomicrobiae bacterium]|nr:GYF domain-containing protein [Verrucomicrobiae bacterium]